MLLSQRSFEGALTSSVMSRYRPKTTNMSKLRFLMHNFKQEMQNFFENGKNLQTIFTLEIYQLDQQCERQLHNLALHNSMHYIVLKKNSFSNFWYLLSEIIQNHHRRIVSEQTFLKNNIHKSLENQVMSFKTLQNHKPRKCTAKLVALS